MNWEDGDLDAIAHWANGELAIGEAIQAVARLRSVPSGTALIREGDELDEVYLILKGRISAIVYSSSGQEIRLGTLEAGEWVGEVAALTGGARSAFAIAARDSRIAVLPAASFITLMETYGSFATQISRLLSERLAATSRRMFEFAAFSAAGRIYSEMIRLSVPGQDAEQLYLSPAPSVTELAARLSIARETTSRVISRLERMQLIVREPQQWRVLAPKALSDMIN